MNEYEVITKLIGPIKPTGCSNADIKRLQNLEAHLSVIELLLSDVSEVADCKDSHEGSVKKIGVTASKFIEMIAEEFGEQVNK